MRLAIDEVERVAAWVRARSGQRRLPVSMRAAIAAVRPRVRIIEAPALPREVESLTTILDSGSPAIFVQPALSAGRRRIAVACGLGHVLFDEFMTAGPEALLDRDQVAEERAETFALALLVPACPGSASAAGPLHSRP